MPSGSRDVGPAPLTSAERTRLVAILGRLGSEFQGERAAAGLLASRMLRERQLTWDALLTAPEASEGGQANLDLCRRHQGHLTTWEGGFIAALTKRHDPPTPGQIEKLAQVAAGLRAKGLA